MHMPGNPNGEVLLSDHGLISVELCYEALHAL